MPCVDMVATGKRIKAMRVAKGMTVKDIQEIFGTTIDAIIAIK